MLFCGKLKNMRAGLGCLALVLLLAGCTIVTGKDAAHARVLTIWTDQSIFALYAGYFNVAQDRFKAEVAYFDNVAEQLSEARGVGAGPDIIVGRWLQGETALGFFRPVDSYLKGLGPAESLFYPALLESGKQNKTRLLLPVSFDLHALVFDRNNMALLPGPFTITPDEIQTAGADYNRMQNGVWTRIGFSPFWNEEFLFLISSLFGTNWREGTPLSWDELQLEESADYLHEWVVAANDSFQADDDFSFKYFYEPPDRLAASGRILFTVERASDYFRLPEERRRTLDFRWIEHAGTITPAENIVYYGIYRNAASRRAAAAFTSWFFNKETQRGILKKSAVLRTSGHIFGISGGFSAVRSVTETIFPEFYEGMLGHAPPPEKILSPGIFPPCFPELKERVILPYLKGRIRTPGSVRPLELRVSDWVRSG
jgi:ABC-type glycerol-3-phosphate transport system substrate-binding protein